MKTLREMINIVEGNNVNLDDIKIYQERETTGHGDSDLIINFKWPNQDSWTIPSYSAEAVAIALNKKLNDSKLPEATQIKDKGDKFIVNIENAGHGDTRHVVKFTSGDQSKNMIYILNKIIHNN